MAKSIAGWAGMAAMAAALAACASRPLPPVPPAPAALMTAPPEGAGPTGLNYGAWRSASTESQAAQFADEIARLYPAPVDAAALRAGMEAEGFQCRDGNRPEARPVPALECRREALDKSCAIDWTVELWPQAVEPRASVAAMCLGAMQ